MTKTRFFACGAGRRGGGAILMGLWLLAAAGLPNRASAQAAATDANDILGGNGDITADAIDFTTGKDGKVDTLTARKNVVLTSEKMNTTCDVLTYDVGRNRMVAVGSPVKIIQEEGTATCKNFEYFPKDGRAILTGNPEVIQKTKGRSVTMTGDIIRMDRQADGRVHFFVDHSNNPGRAHVKLRDLMKGSPPEQILPPGVRQPTLEMSTGTETAKEKKDKSASSEPVKIDQSNRDKIPEPQTENE